MIAFVAVAFSTLLFMSTALRTAISAPITTSTVVAVLELPFSAPVNLSAVNENLLTPLLGYDGVLNVYAGPFQKAPNTAAVVIVYESPAAFSLAAAQFPTLFSGPISGLLAGQPTFKASELLSGNPRAPPQYKYQFGSNVTEIVYCTPRAGHSSTFLGPLYEATDPVLARLQGSRGGLLWGPSLTEEGNGLLFSAWTNFEDPNPANHLDDPYLQELGRRFDVNIQLTALTEFTG